MVSKKKRLYVALYPSGVADNEERKYGCPSFHIAVIRSRLNIIPRYHWSFLIGPKVEDRQQVPGMRYHVKNHFTHGWTYEEVSVSNVQNTNTLLARIVVAKVEDERRLVEIFRTTQVVQNDPQWRCRTWISDVLARLAIDGKAVGTSQLDWARSRQWLEATLRKKLPLGGIRRAKTWHHRSRLGTCSKKRKSCPELEEQLRRSVSSPRIPNFLMHCRAFSSIPYTHSKFSPPFLTRNLHLQMVRVRFKELWDDFLPGFSGSISTPSRSVFPVVWIPP
ncbi:hypothetical protein ABEF95_004138 [Exophiala dermatitidis]